MTLKDSQIQIRVDEELKRDAIALFESLGFDLSTAIRLFLRKSVAEKRIPFDLREEASKESEELVEEIRKKNLPPMGDFPQELLDMINEEINACRKERRKLKEAKKKV